MKTKDIHQTIIFKASPHEVYEALMYSKLHAKFTGAPAKISREVGGKFTAYGDYIDGENLELVPDKKVVQKWRGNEWPQGHYSVITFSLTQIKEGTRLDFKQTSVPEEHVEHIRQGWIEHYWDKMKKTFEW